LPLGRTARIDDAPYCHRSPWSPARAVSQGPGLLNTYDDGVTNNGVQNGALHWDVPLGAPGNLFYDCQFHAAMTGTITVIDAPPPSGIFADGFEDIVR
jgi:hypothetical protein